MHFIFVVIGKSKILDYENLYVNEEYRRLQSFWDWRSGSNSLQYGCMDFDLS